MRSGDGERILPVLVTEPARLRRGDVFRHVLAGAGGYGDPLARDIESVRWDVIEEKVSRAHAAEAYGVAFQPGAAIAVDRPGTKALREKMRRERRDEGTTA